MHFNFVMALRLIRLDRLHHALHDISGVLVGPTCQEVLRLGSLFWTRGPRFSTGPIVVALIGVN